MGGAATLLPPCVFSAWTGKNFTLFIIFYKIFLVIFFGHRKANCTANYKLLSHSRVHYFIEFFFPSKFASVFEIKCKLIKVFKIKDPRYRPGVAQRVPGRLRFPDLVTTAQEGGKVVSFTHRPHLPPENSPGTHFC